MDDLIVGAKIIGVEMASARRGRGVIVNVASDLTLIAPDHPVNASTVSNLPEPAAS